MAQVCRTCGLKAVHSKEIFDKENFEILLNIVKLTGISLTRSPGVPTEICLSCLIDLNDAVAFRERCIKTNNLWVGEDNHQDLAKAVKKPEQPSNTGFGPKVIALNIVPLSKGLRPQKGFLQSAKLAYPSKKGASDQPDNPSEGQAIPTAEAVSFKETEAIKVVNEPILGTDREDSDSHSEDDEEILPPTTRGRCKKKEILKPFYTLEDSAASFDEILDPIDINTEALPKRKRDRKGINKNSSQTQMVLAKKMDKFFCEQCGRGFKEKGNLNLHLQRHTGVKPYECPDCGKREINAYNMNIHIRVKHRGDKPFACKYCGEGFVTSTERCRHQSRIHEMKPKKRTHKCAVCGIGFQFQSELKQHEVVHSGERNYPCEKCNLGFKTKSSLNGHFATKLHRRRAAEYKNK